MTLEQFAERFPTLQYDHLKIVERCVENCHSEAEAEGWLDMIASEQGTPERLVSALAMWTVWDFERRAIVFRSQLYKGSTL